MAISGWICWRLSCSGQFDTRSYYKAFRGNWDIGFPWKNIWIKGFHTR